MIFKLGSSEINSIHCGFIPNELGGFIPNELGLKL
jgi:hypothetical protein